MAARGLVIDYGGVLTTSLGEAFAAFCEREGVPHERLRDILRHAYHAEDPETVVARVETGAMGIEEFERHLAEALSEGLRHPIAPAGLVARMLEGVGTDEEMVAVVRELRGGGIRTALLSNSWGLHYYPKPLLKELFDVVVISGEVGLRKPHPDIYRLAAERLGLPASACVFVDDFEANVHAAERVGMAGILHRDATETRAALSARFGPPQPG